MKSPVKKENSKPSVLIALGGNALSPPENQAAEPMDEFQIARRSMENIVSLMQMGYEKIIITHGNAPQRSDERRVGKECRSRWSP